MRIISFTGPRGSGKDTCADILKAEGVSQGKISFAGPMKKILSDIYGVEPILFEDRELKETPFDKPLYFGLIEFHKLLKKMSEYVPNTREPFFTSHRLTTPRHALQVIGTDIIRNYIDDHWHVKAAFSPKGLQGLDPEGTYCVTDARFPNEYEWLNNRFMLDFKGFYIARPEAEAILDQATHASELAVKEVRKFIPSGQVLDNSGSIEELTKQLLTKV